MKLCANVSKNLRIARLFRNLTKMADVQDDMVLRTFGCGPGLDGGRLQRSGAQFLGRYGIVDGQLPRYDEVLGSVRTGIDSTLEQEEFHIYDRDGSGVYRAGLPRGGRYGC